MYVQLLLLLTLVDLLLSLPGRPRIVTQLSMALAILIPVFLAVSWALAALLCGLGLWVWYSVSQVLSVSCAWCSGKRSALYALIFLSTFALSASSDFLFGWASQVADWVTGLLSSTYLPIVYKPSSYTHLSFFTILSAATSVLSDMSQSLLAQPVSTYWDSLAVFSV